MAAFARRNRSVNRDLIAVHQVGALPGNGNENVRVLGRHRLEDRVIGFDWHLRFYQLVRLFHRLIELYSRRGRWERLRPILSNLCTSTVGQANYDAESGYCERKV